MNVWYLNMLKLNIKNNREFQVLSKLLKSMPRSSLQRNSLFESDCEILEVGNQFLAVSTDSIGEEIDLDIYRSSKLWGWMTVMNSVSDLAASGTKPLGMLISNQWKYGTSLKVQKDFFTGAQKALKLSGVPLLGGDSGNGESHCHTSTVLGLSNLRPLSRSGVKKGDILCLLGKNQTGNGPALAFKILFKLSAKSFTENYFRPVSLIKKMMKLRPLLRASIDTSDGIATSLQILSEINHVGFKTVWNEKTISKLAMKFCINQKIHPLLLWMSDLGDLQTLVAISEKNLSKALKLEPDLLPIARATDYANGITIQYEQKKFKLPIKEITNCPRNLSALRKVMVKLNERFNELDKKA